MHTSLWCHSVRQRCNSIRDDEERYASWQYDNPSACAENGSIKTLWCSRDLPPRKKFAVGVCRPVSIPRWRVARVEFVTGRRVRSNYANVCTTMLMIHLIQYLYVLAGCSWKTKFHKDGTCNLYGCLLPSSPAYKSYKRWVNIYFAVDWTHTRHSSS